MSAGSWSDGREAGFPIAVHRGEGMRVIRVAMVVLVSLVLVAGCTTGSGTKVSQDSLSSIRKGVTTKQELIGMFGQPQTSMLSADGGEALMWRYMGMKTSAKSYIPIVNMFGDSGVSTESSFLHVRVNKSGVVQDYSLTHGSEKL